jgi:small subunit ribosomal protein S26e
LFGFAGYALPKLYHKMYFSISAAIHSHYVRVRSRTNRRKRAPPQRFAPRREDKPAAAAGGAAAAAPAAAAAK